MTGDNVNENDEKNTDREMGKKRIKRIPRKDVGKGGKGRRDKGSRNRRKRGKY